MKNWKGIWKSITLFCVALCCMFGMTSVVSAKTVAKIGNKKYSSLPAAVKAVKNGQTIVLQSNIDLKGGTLKLNKKAEYTIDLNKRTISNAGGWEDDAINLTKGNVTIKNGKIKTSRKEEDWGGYEVMVESKTTLNLSALYFNGTFNVSEGGTCNINSGTYEYIDLTNGGTLKINGGTFTKTVLHNQGAARINTGTFKSLCCLDNEGSMYITGGTFQLLKKDAYNRAYGSYTGGWISTGVAYCTPVKKAKMYISGGNFSLVKGSIRLYRDKLYIIRSKYSQLKKYVDNQGGQLCAWNGEK